ncbi:MAG: hypothetical protein IJ496_06695 [Ruminococcus sp.]|nr:hypothetical protein [Ruminococcus sp.]
MRSYEEIAKSVFERRDAYLQKKEKRLALVKKSASAVMCISFVTILGLGLWSNDINHSESPEPGEKSLILYSHEAEIAAVTSVTAASSSKSGQTQQNTAVSVTEGIHSTVNTTATVVPVPEMYQTTAVPAVSQIQVWREALNTQASQDTDAAVKTTLSTDESRIEQSTAAFTAISTTAAKATTITTTTAAATAAEREKDPCWPEEGFSYILRASGSRSDTVYIDPITLENGDYTFNASLYILSDEQLPSDVNDISAAWDGYLADGTATKYIRFENRSSFEDAPTEEDLLAVSELLESGVIDAENLIVNDKPTCLSWIQPSHNRRPELRNKWNGYEKTFITVHKGDIFTTPGYTVYSAGMNQIYIENEETGEREYYSLYVDEITGQATCEELNLTIDGYNPDTPEGNLLLKEIRHISASRQQDTAPEWFGGRSDTFPLTTFDVVIEEDTPEGIYYVAFDLANNNINNRIAFRNRAGSSRPVNLRPLNEKCTEFANDEQNWLKIVVGKPEE